MDPKMIQLMIDEMEARQKARFLESGQTFIVFFTSQEEMDYDCTVNMLRHLKMYGEYMAQQ